jgi:hypothetical protein
MGRANVVPPLFIDSAKEIIARLAGKSGPAWEMTKEAEELLSIFEGWGHVPAARAKAVQRLINLHRRAMDFLVKNKST